MEATPVNLENIFLLRKANVWYTMCDGSWSNPDIWVSNAIDKKNVTSPQPGDTVYINHNVTVDISVNINNVYGAGNLIIPASTTVNITGMLNMGAGTVTMTGTANVLNLYGVFNSLGTLVNGTGSYVQYCSILQVDQWVMPLTYQNLTTTCTGRALLTGNTTINGNFNQQSNFECGAFSLTVNGSAVIGSTAYGYTFSKNSSTGSILFAGNVDFEGYTNLSGNPNVEFRGGMTIHTFSLITGSGVFSFTTNNQTISCSAFLGGSWNASIVITGAITLTLNGSSPFTANSTINGTASGSTFNNSGVLYLATNTTPMTTGVFNYQYTSTSTLGYIFNGSATLPYSSYANLLISGTGIKTLGANTTVGQSLTNNGNLECGGYNLTVSGAFTHNGGGNFTANAFCNIVFVGFAEFQINNGSGYVDLRTGNPNVEFRGGWDVHAFACYTGTGTFSFTTNNQAVSFSAYNGGVLAANFLINGITVTFTSGSSIPLMLGTLNGDNSSSTFINQGTFAYNNAQQPMQTGVLTNSATASTFIYSLNGNQNVTGGTYKNLTLSTGGVKTLMGNVIVNNTYTLSSPATLNTNGYTLTH